MNPPTDFAQLLPFILVQLAPYLVSGPALSHLIGSWDIIKKAETPDFVKIGIAFVVALGGVVGANLIAGSYAGGATFGTYAQSTLHDAGVLWSTMTITNVGLDKLVPSFADWSATTLTRLIVAVRKGVDTLINQGKPAPVTANG